MKFLSRYAHINWALADQAMVSGVNFLTGILLARFLGLEEFGRFTLVWMVVLFVSSLQHALINSPMMSIGPKQTEEDAPTYYGAVVIHQVIFCLGSAVLIYLGMQASTSFFPDWKLNELALPLTFAVLTVQCQDFLRRFLFTRKDGRIAFKIDIFRYLGQLLLLPIAYWTIGLNSGSVLMFISFAAIVSVLVACFNLGAITIRKSALRLIFYKHWSFSKWLLGSAILQGISNNIFTIILAYVVGSTSVGALRAAQNVMGLCHIIFMGLENVVPKQAALRLHNKGELALSHYIQKVLSFGLLAILLIASIAFIFPSFLLSVLYGVEFVEYAFLLQWFSVIYLVIYVAFPLRIYLRTLELTNGIFLANLISVTFSIFISYPLISNFSLLGCVIGILLFNVSMVLSLLFYKIKSGYVYDTK